jgi:cytochrome P450
MRTSENPPIGRQSGPQGGRFLDPAVVDDPYPFYAQLRENTPVCEVADTGVHLVAKRHLIEDALRRPEDFSANLTGVLITGPGGRPEIFDLTRFGTAVDAIANADEPAHAVHRSLVLPHVRPAVIASLEDLLRRWSAELMQPAIDAGHGDWIERVANPLPTMAMASVVGLPVEDADRLLDWAMAGTEILAGTIGLERLAALGAKTAELAAYLGRHLHRALVEPTPERPRHILGEIAAGIRDGRIGERDGVAILVVLAGAGGESTSSLTGSAVRILAERPELQAELRTDPALIEAFVEETVRLESSFRGHYRFVKRDSELGGVRLPRGSRLFLLWSAANRDPEIYDRADEVDLRRANPRDHLGFGKGSHFCVGARLARLEARVILEELLARTRSFGLDPARPPAYVSSIFVRRHARLDLRFEGLAGRR